MYSLQPVSRCCQDVLSPFRHQTGWNLLIYQAEKRNFDFQKSELRFFISKNLLRGGFLQCQHLTDAISEHSHMTLDYFYGQAGELFSFYRIPKALFQEPRFQNLSTDAKTLYGILLDRMSLSAKNGWLDEQGRVFIMPSVEGHIICNHTDFVTNFLSVVTKSWTGIDSCALIFLIPKARIWDWYEVIPVQNLKY